MPSIRKMVEQILKIDEQDNHQEIGGYPVFFKNDLTKIEFILLLRWKKFKRKVKKLCRL